MIPVWVLAAALLCGEGRTPAPPPDASPAPDPKPGAEGNKRVELNLLGHTDAQAGESRRNENLQFNLIDNNALKELSVRLGTTATIVEEFQPERNYFGVEFGNSPTAVLQVTGRPASGFHGRIWEAHQNSVFAARSFFQVGNVKPAHDNDYGFRVGLPSLGKTQIQLDGSQKRSRGNVNGNVLVPRADERAPLATDPATRAIVARYLAAYPAEPPNRTDINERALNTNSPQLIDDNNGGVRIDRQQSDADRFIAQYQFTGQHVSAFQLVAGQNPNTDTKSHRARLTWNRTWSAHTVSDFTAGFDRLSSLLVPEPNSVGPMVSISGLTTLGPLGTIPINRALNLYRYGGNLNHVAGKHKWNAGFGVIRRQLNGEETDAHRGFFAFANDFGRDSITNLRLGTPSQHIKSIGNVHRGFRNVDLQFYGGDTWRVRSNLQIQIGVRYQPVTTPSEVNHLNTIPYACDCNNLSPQFGLAWRLPGKWGNLRTAYGLHFGEIYPVTFQQVRFSPPGSVKIVVQTPSLVDPLGSLKQGGEAPDALGNLYLLDPKLSSPYSHQYNFGWEPQLSRRFSVQFGYVGSRSHRLLTMWYLNRGHVVDGIAQTTATINQRRPDQRYADIRWVLNGSRGYYDAARASFVTRNWHGVTVEAAYWFSKALDLGANYTHTASDADSRLTRSQSEYESHKDLKALSTFDQPHAVLFRSTYATPAIGRGAARWLGKWNLSGVALLKSGTPFAVVSGSDAPGFGNVDGNGGDRPNLMDTSILGRTIGNPDTSQQLLPRSAFRYMAPTDPSGNLGNNTFRKGSIQNVNASVSRTFALRSDTRLTFRAESINAFNTPQFAPPGAELANANFGAITNTLNDGRTLRFQLELAW